MVLTDAFTYPVNASVRLIFYPRMFEPVTIITVQKSSNSTTLDTHLCLVLFMSFHLNLTERAMLKRVYFSMDPPNARFQSAYKLTCPLSTLSPLLLITFVSPKMDR